MPKIRMPYPCLFYGFSLILQLITYLYCPISDSCILCELQVERAIFESILEQRVEVHKSSRNVATSQRHDVPTSRRQRDFCLSIIKRKKGTKNQGIEEVRTRARKAEQQRPKSAKKRPTFLFSPFSDKTADVLYIEYSCNYFQYVLVSHLGFC